jgi:cation diffusion facilitator CzcD-associated flavoprotein CzcO/acetyl esterase/lipase
VTTAVKNSVETNLNIGLAIGPATVTGEQPRFDVVVVGAGFAGMYLLHRLRTAGFSTTVLETGADVGGTWYWNRYPGARCDVESLDYSYSFDPQLDEEWQWSEKYASQPEILRYAQHVAERYDLRRDIQFDTRVAHAHWDDSASLWRLTTNNGKSLTARHYVMATGCLSVPKEVDIEGVDRFVGETYWTSRWPHEGVDFTGKRVAVIGTGSSAIQSIPIIAGQASHLTVFQRTPNFSIPAWNGSTRPEKRAAVESDRAAYRQAARESGAGVPAPVIEVSALTVSADERNKTYEAAWQRGGIIEFLGTFSDHGATEEANSLVAEFVRNKIRQQVNDPETAEALCPTSYPIGTKRLCVDTNYYVTFNRPNVKLVDLRKRPMTGITEKGVQVGEEVIEVDAIVFATGFDAMTGALVSVDITGRGGLTLKEAWAAGPRTYLGLQVEQFPNLFMVTGPGSPSVLSNMMVSIEQHVEWISDTLINLRAEGTLTIEPTPTAVDGWVQHVNDFANITLFPKADSWYIGANVPGKPRVFLPYIGGVHRYRVACDEAVAKDYLGFIRRGPDQVKVTDGVIRRVQPDVAILLEMMAQLGLPPLETLPPESARAMMDAGAATRAPGPAVAAVEDGSLPGADGPLNYRLYRPSAAGPLPITVYFHGGGWVLGSHESDDPFCRDICVRTNSIVISVDYRHAPEAVFPAAVDDAIAAVQWIADHAAELGGRTDGVAVAGWSAGANLAAVVAQQARTTGGPSIKAQMLLTPVTNADFSTGSYQENGEGYILTKALMQWFFDNYVAPEHRNDPRVSPLKATSLSGLPPAVVVTCEFDPLRDDGNAYAAALSAAGVNVTHIQARGHTHTSVPAVDLLPTSAAIREQMTDAFRALLH